MVVSRMAVSRIEVSQELISARWIRSNTHILILMMMQDEAPCIIGDYMVTLEHGVVCMRSAESIKIRLGSHGLLFELVHEDNAIEILNYNTHDPSDSVTIRGWGSYQSIIDEGNISASTAQILEIYYAYMAPILAMASRCVLLKPYRR